LVMASMHLKPRSPLVCPHGKPLQKRTRVYRTQNCWIQPGTTMYLSICPRRERPIGYLERGRCHGCPNASIVHSTKKTHALCCCRSKRWTCLWCYRKIK